MRVIFRVHDELEFIKRQSPIEVKYSNGTLQPRGGPFVDQYFTQLPFTSHSR
jgi:hypothetical protein